MEKYKWIGRYTTSQFDLCLSILTLNGSTVDLQVDRLIDYLTFQFVLVYIDADWVNCKLTSG